MLTLASLQAFASKLTDYNNDVAQRTQQLKATKAGRLSKYEDLRDRVQRVKAYIHTTYRSPFK